MMTILLWKTVGFNYFKDAPHFENIKYKNMVPNEHNNLTVLVEEQIYLS